ncbi:RagB/SusD family nutrient uptake outer membrane protein [Chitinophaga nivalis]|uniref:RagB/SusD family nutrient uptake outer membrane protein n=1 Tax=Chitinophaga nivalis TaxID=2991709 RepID=A0ABT3ILT2_9BACT|nr:RagB/SusD family nutrient uptake outer membrane protein [Chitinophaga nivalis]MCW3465369.1 RagB/SusD family nutrient uptake outer membrane protein [Chitinophaga nivalis]MCW3484939.1 RagB/SusD family nutrient uptake outer membrane protein [Chitinophaga nivalis]
MKKNRLTLLTIFATVVLSACSKDFLNNRPTNAITDDQIFNTADNVETVINGTWSYMFESFFTYAVPGYKSIDLTSDAMGSDVAVTLKYGLRDAYAYGEMLDKTQNRVGAYWGLLYKVIDNANNIIAKVDNATGDEGQKAYLKGQAYALRAYCYLTLASYYQLSVKTNPNAKAVPIYTEPSTSTTPGKPRETIARVYQQVIDDLLKAEPLLKNYQRDGAKKWKIDLHVAQGLLARAYLYSGKYADAATKAAAARSGYSLMSGDDYNKGFNDVNNVEWIWGHGQTPNQSNASYNFNYLDVSSAASYYYSFMADPFFKDNFTQGDVRTRLFEWDTTPSREGFLRYKKFRFRDPQAMVGDLVLMRAAEMYLIEAEAYAESGNQGKAVEALNTLRNARNAVPYDPAHAGNLKDTILLERRKELWGEGFSLSDIIRTGGTVNRRAFLSFNGGDSIIKVPRANGTFKSVKAVGHRILSFPNKVPFTPNSTNYLFAIPIAEEQNNPNLYN